MLRAVHDQLTFIEQVEADIARLKTRLEHIRDGRLRDIVTADIEHLQARHDLALGIGGDEGVEDVHGDVESRVRRASVRIEAVGIRGGAEAEGATRFRSGRGLGEGRRGEGGGGTTSRCPRARSTG